MHGSSCRAEAVIRTSGGEVTHELPEIPEKLIFASMTPITLWW